MDHIDLSEQLNKLKDILRLPREMRWMENGFTIVPNSIINANISKESKLLYIVLLMFAFQKGNCFPSVKTLGTILSANERTIRRNLKKLKEEKLIKVENRNGKSSVYTLLEYIPR
jgi:hypothetical protein